ncbi:M42 family metallopeptidase [Carboxydochorda subterranea]|uniref:M42 family metallopeptidase n=1 Tax=Carboxydichorda subterranea TaxID=3109565 RepID=A0ABZ1BW76_9FIRM|nr:M42 family metallopeptidase [Limnochorda sp. L945t]WRP16387.1 M42 family metallopeptidase [Limnochorda sp. L945t]
MADASPLTISPQTLELLRELTEAAGVPGFEDPVRAVMRRHLEGSGELVRDAIGSVAAVHRGSAERPRILMAGHMDEVGFMVGSVTDEGFLRFQTLGGWWEQVMLAQRVTVLGEKGPVPGVVGSKPPHILSPEDRKKVVEKKEMFIDVGASDRAEVEAMGIRPGDPVVPATSFTLLAGGRRALAKAFDNRVGCALAVEVLRRSASGPGHPNTLIAGATVQEEVGLRGAATLAELSQPDVAFALEVSIAGDTPGVKPEEAQSKLGKGPAITLYDASMVPHRKLRDFVVETAKEAGIPYQFDLMPGGGTDAGRFHLWRRGVPSLVIGVPARYIHTGSSIIDLSDFEAAARLMTEVVRRLDATILDGLLS